MAALIKSHAGLKPLEEVDTEMADLIAQEQRRQVRRGVRNEETAAAAERGRARTVFRRVYVLLSTHTPTPSRARGTERRLCPAFHIHP